jgi:hypothetical protein
LLGGEVQQVERLHVSPLFCRVCHNHTMFARSLRQLSRPLQASARRLASSSSSSSSAAGAAGIARLLQRNHKRMLSLALAGAAAYCAVSGDAGQAAAAAAEPAEKLRTLYPLVEPYKTGRLRVSDVHELYYEERCMTHVHLLRARDFVHV